MARHGGGADPQRAARAEIAACRRSRRTSPKASAPGSRRSSSKPSGCSRRRSTSSPQSGQLGHASRSHDRGRAGQRRAPIRASSARSRRARCETVLSAFAKFERPARDRRMKEPRMSTKTPRRLIVGISGASGTIYGIRMLELLQEDRHRDPSGHEQVGRDDAGLRDQVTSRRTSGAGLGQSSGGRHRRVDLVGLVPDHGHDRSCRARSAP